MRVCVFFFRRSSQRRTLGPSSTVRAFSSSSLMSWIMASWWRESRWKRERGEREKGGRKRDGEKKSGEGGGEDMEKKKSERETSASICLYLQTSISSRPIIIPSLCLSIFIIPFLSLFSAWWWSTEILLALAKRHIPTGVCARVRPHVRSPRVTCQPFNKVNLWWHWGHY